MNFIAQFFLDYLGLSLVVVAAIVVTAVLISQVNALLGIWEKAVKLRATKPTKVASQCECCAAKDKEIQELNARIVLEQAIAAGAGARSDCLERSLRESVSNTAMQKISNRDIGITAEETQSVMNQERDRSP